MLYNSINNLIFSKIAYRFVTILAPSTDSKPSTDPKPSTDSGDNIVIIDACKVC